MPLSKYHIRNEYGMADPELYRAADRDDPEALLEAVAMSGLVGILRQLGDLAEFAFEIFHDLHEEVMATAARGHGLITRVQQLEAEVPLLEKAFFSQVHHSSFFTNGGVDWHPNLQFEQNLVTQGDLPRFVMDSYEECRGPPRLFLLDKFDVAGAGACLKRYTDPSFFKMESASSGTAAEVHREKRIRKVKQKRRARLRDGEGPIVVPTHAKLHQLLLEERIENGYTDPARLVKLKKRQLNGSAVESKSGISYMAKFLESPSPDHKMIYETSIIPLPVKSTSDDSSDSEPGIKLEISCISPVKKASRNKSPNEHESELKSFSEMDGKANGDFVKVKEQVSAGVTEGISSNHPEFPAGTDLTVDEQKKIGGILDGYHSDDVISEVDNYMDALTAMESELELDSECKPKNNLLNIQKVTDANDKKEHTEEHQLEPQFSFSQSFGASSTSDDSSFKQDRNEEHIEAQAQSSDSHSVGTSILDNNNSFRRDGDRHIEMQGHFSDSQSVENSSISDDNISFKKDRSYFHHSDDSSSSVVENIQSEPISFTNTKYYDPEVEENTPSNQLPQIVEFQNSDCSKFVAHDDAHVQEDVSDSGRASHDDAHVQEDEVSHSGQVSYDLMSSGSVLNTDLSTASPVASPVGTQSVETSSDPVELKLRLEDDENGTDVESITAELVPLFMVKDDACPVDSSDKKLLDNLDGSDPHVQSEDLVHVSYQLELAHENDCSDHSVKFQAESANENSCEGLAGRDIGSVGEDPIPSSMEELDLNSGTTPVLDSQNSKEEECITAAQLSVEYLTPIVEIPPVSSLAGELSSDSTDNNPHDEPSSVDIEVVSSDERQEMVHDVETRSTCSDDQVEDDVHFKHLSSPDNHTMVSDVVTVYVQSEDQARLTVPSVSSAENDVGIVTCLSSDLICSSSRSLPELQEPLPGSSNSYLIEKESNEAELPQISMDLNTEKRENQLESLLDILSFDIGCSPTSDCTKMEESISTVEDPHEKEMEVNDAVTGKLLTELEKQRITDQPEIAYAGVQLNWKESVASDLSHSERCNDIESSSYREKFQHSAFVDDLEMVPDFSGLDSRKSESIVDGQNDPLQNCRDDFSSPPCNQLQSETDLDLFSQSKVGEVDAQFLPRGEENSASEKSQSQKMQSNQLEQESTHATSEFASEFRADELSSSHSLPESSGQEVNPTKPVMDPLKHLLPEIVPEATVSNLDEMPPMPPLPPMQWRMGKIQHSSLVSHREEVEVSQASFQPMPPSMLPILPDRKSQFGLPTSERENLLYQNPFVPVMTMESDKLQHSSGFPVGVSGHPVAMPLQFPIMVNDAKGQYNYVVLDRSQIQNPFLTLPIVTKGRPPHAYIVASEGEMSQNSNLYPPIPPSKVAVSVNDSISLQEKPTQPPSQLMTHTISEVETIEQSINNVVSMDRTPDVHLIASEGEMVQNSNPCPPIPPEVCSVSGQDSISAQEEPNQPQLMTETSSEDITRLQSTSNDVSTGRPQHGHVAASEGEMVQSSNPCPPIPLAECAVSEDDSISSQEKPTHPSNQLMTEANHVVKSPLPSKINAEGGQEHPTFSLMLPPNMESMEPNQSFLSSEGETAFSLDEYAQSSDLEGEKINGKPKNKLPRPRNPLIDAVAAHDKSKLRRVTERVMPEVAPKVDERDSLLEQIRTKSFNLKPTVSTRPSIQGPKTNLKLAAILEKANAIRQAFAGSDEDDDADSWSDS